MDIDPCVDFSACMGGHMLADSVFVLSDSTKHLQLHAAMSSDLLVR